MTRLKKLFLGAGLAAALAVCVTVGFLVAADRADPKADSGAAAPAAAAGQESPGAADTIPVQVVRPKRDPAFVLYHEEPAFVDPYYRANLEARVAGPVRYLQKDIGDDVQSGERLLEIDVPDLVQEVEQKKAAVQRARMDLRLAQQQVAVKEAAVEIANKMIGIAQSQAGQAKATMDFRWLQWERVKIMVSRRTAYEEMAEEQKRDYDSAREAYAGAQAGVEKATADYNEAKAKLAAARADVDLKQALVRVAERDRDREQALRDYAVIRAPFQGVLTRRNVDPGSFVSASTTRPEPLLTVERTDIVTVTMWLPDNFAPYIKPDTDVIIEMSELPGQRLHAKVTRFSPSLRSGDRRMPVEVDLYNRNPQEYQEFLAREQQAPTPYADLKGGKLPVLARITGKNIDRAEPHRLLPGMIGTMRLLLRERELRDAYLLPSSVVFSKGGEQYIYVVKNGKARLVRVQVPVDDGRLAKVVKIVKVGNREVKQEMTGEDEVVAVNQGELTDGQPVTATPIGQ